MNISVGIVGLPNVGKSTLFNALTNNCVDAQNYPFCTIDPNTGVVEVLDSRIDELSKVSGTKNKVYAVIEFVDIAGLVKGAASGAGLGNQFLANIREVAAIAHVVRDFEDTDVIHVDGKIDPRSDIETIEMELIFKDLETLKKKSDSYSRQSRGDKKLVPVVEWLEGLKDHLEEGNLAESFESNEGVEEVRLSLSLLTDKSFIFVVNKKNEDISQIEKELRDLGKHVISMDVKLEYEISMLENEEKQEYLTEFNLGSTGLEKLASVCYGSLGLLSFFTSGEQETRAWTIKKGSTAQDAAGTIHTDFAKNFIAAEVVAYDDFIEHGGWAGVRSAGKVRLEGRDYIVKEGEIFLFKHN